MLPDFPLIVADESVDRRIISALENEGYSILSIALKFSGISDKKVIDLAFDKKAFIITENKDFGDELVYKKAPQSGSLLIRLRNIPIEAKIQLIINCLHNNGKRMLDAFSVITAQKLRIHKYND
ncbi:MAG: hypothetical protein EPN39_20445 [Chitinophagaceae bacterium]|nr:MAG: hypothetical protein EPN39_20445 [Chitinophagaceae bacterium]